MAIIVYQPWMGRYVDHVFGPGFEAVRKEAGGAD
jgi:hypothetical protein